MIDNKIEKLFPPNVVFIGYIIIVFSLIIFFNKETMAISLLLLLVGVLMSFTSIGIKIDVEKKIYKRYTNFYGVKYGKWISYEEYPYLGILSRNIGYSMFSRAQVKTTITNKCYEIYLMSENHRVRHIIKRFDNKNIATKEAERLENELKLKLVVYNPY